jgi:hypothetical protein
MGFPALVQVLKGAGPDVILPSLVRTIPWYYHAPLARALQQGAAHGPLARSRAVPALLRALQGAAQEAGLSKAVVDRQGRQRQRAEAEAAASMHAKRRLDAAAPKLAAVARGGGGGGDLERGAGGADRPDSPLACCLPTESSASEPGTSQPPKLPLRPEPLTVDAPVTSWEEVAALDAGDLLPRWEATRRKLHGGRGRLFELLRLHARDGDPSAAVVDFGAAASRPWTALDAAHVGADRYAAVPIRAMGNFGPLLSRQQLLRDPLDEDLVDRKLSRADELDLVRRRWMAVDFSGGGHSARAKAGGFGGLKRGSSFSSAVAAVAAVAGDAAGEAVALAVGREGSGGRNGGDSAVEASAVPFLEEQQAGFQFEELAILAQDTPRYRSSFDDDPAAVESTTAATAPTAAMAELEESRSTWSVAKASMPLASIEANPLAKRGLVLPQADAHRVKRRRTSPPAAPVTDASPAISAAAAASMPTDTMGAGSLEASSAVRATGEGAAAMNVVPGAAALGRPQTPQPSVMAVASSPSPVSVATGVAGAAGAAAAVGGCAPPTDFSNLCLPEGWIIAYSKREQRQYFFNTATNTSLWVPPPGATQVS